MIEDDDTQSRNEFASFLADTLSHTTGHNTMLTVVCAICEKIIDERDGKAREVVEALDFLIHRLTENYGVEDTEGLE